MSNMRLTEKYRPGVWSEVVGQDKIVSSIKNIVDRVKLAKGQGITPHFLFLGPPGVGKTTVAEIIGKELGYEVVEYNASDDRTLVFVRDEIKRLASFKATQVIILDEFDEMIKPAQMAMKRIMETTDSIFILLANHEWKIEDPIKSRCAKFTFSRITDDVIEKKIVSIIVAEGIKFSPTEEVKQGLKDLVKNADGDLRRAINDLESITDANKYITNESVALLQKPVGLGLVALNYALQGDFDSAKESIEKAYVEGRYDPRKTIHEIYDAIPKLQLDQEIKIRMFEKLGQTDANVKFGGDPVVQIITYIAFVWLLPHLSKCPVLSTSGV